MTIKSIETKFGNAKLNPDGYYRISSRKEGNHGKLLHRLIFEDFYKFIPENYVVHHKDENKLNNCILNLQLMKLPQHFSHHNKGDKNPKVWLGKKHSKETREKISNSLKGEKNHNYGGLSDEHKKKISKSSNTFGFYRVTQERRDDVKQGFLWVYQYYAPTQKKIASVNLTKLKVKVISKGLEWGIIDEDKARTTCDEYCYIFDDLVV